MEAECIGCFFRTLRFNLKKNWEEVKEMSYKDMDDIGTHSICKGLITCFSSGKTAAPLAVAINIRRGWIMGIQKTYMLWEETGDNYCGPIALI